MFLSHIASRRKVAKDMCFGGLWYNSKAYGKYRQHPSMKVSRQKSALEDVDVTNSSKVGERHMRIHSSKTVPLRLIQE